ncbi:MAG: NAD-dependent epimerase/dehydratase family protein, partial [Pseudomonadales bacterium]
MSTRVLITGVGGFVGGHLYRALGEATDWQLATASRGAAPDGALAHTQLDLLQASDAQLDALLANTEICYHVAGMAHHAALQDPDGAALKAFNVALSERLFRAAVRCGVSRFVWLSSSKVLGDISAAPLAVQAPYAPVGHYARSKMHGEL